MANFSDEEKQIIKDFNELKPLIISWGDFVDKKLTEILTTFTESKKLQIFPKHRIKDEISYMVKVLYSRSYKNPLLETEDKVGTRAVFLTSKDVLDAQNVIQEQECWNCKVGKDFRDELYHRPEVFGYQSLHLIVSPKEGFDADPKTYPLLTCEIQLRTLLQHTYAEIAHDNAYKGPYKNDKEILRILAKSMALMETTDDHFCSIFNMMVDPKRVSKVFLMELIQLFKDFVPTYKGDLEQVEVNDLILELLTKKNIELNDLQTFVKSEANFLKGGIKAKNGLLLQQPTILLVAFYLRKYESFLIREWPLSNEALKKVYQSFGIAYEFV